MDEQTNEPSSALEPATRRWMHAAARGGAIGPTLTRRIIRVTKQIRRILSLQFVFLALVLCAIRSPGANEKSSSDSEVSPQVDSYTREQNQRAAAEQQELFRVRVAIPDAVAEDVPPAKTPPVVQTVAAQTDAIAVSNTFLLGSGVFFLGLILTLRVLAPQILDRINRRLNPWMLVPEAVTARPTQVRAEEEAFAKFVAAFKVGPSNSADSNPPTTVAARSEPATQNGEADLAVEVGVEDFYAGAQEQIAAQRTLLEDINQTSDDVARQRAIARLCSEVHAFKTEASRPELQVVWQVASALEGLLKQLADKAKNVTPSTLRTVAGAVELLSELSVPELNPGLLKDRPLHFLAVDNDLISGKALIMALKKALMEPHLAIDSDAACALVGRHAYDVIFLDAQMSGVDAFELCTRIHDSTLNRITPVVFVTRQSDFDTWARSALNDGSDLMSKPFLTFEVILKALTLSLRRRLQGGLPEREGSSDFDEAAFAPASAHTDSGNGAAEGKVHEIDAAPDDEAFEVSGNADDTESFECADSDELGVDVFLERAAVQLEPLRGLFELMLQTGEEEVRKELLAEAYVRIRTFAPGTNLNAAHPAMRVSTALQGLFRKLLQNPASANPSTLVTAAFAVDLLGDLCVAGISPDLITDPPIRMLVVDDNAGSRRTLTNALQVAFEQPDSVDNGEAALSLAAEKRFDVIFLDVQMPGMDGFAVCSGIRETTLNQATPVVYVTGRDNSSIRSRMSLSGGNDFVSKPFLTSEVTVKALTFAMRGRLQQLELAHA
jgi:PleD family two-component response regulator